jgi:hypothetical protein
MLHGDFEALIRWHIFHITYAPFLVSVVREEITYYGFGMGFSGTGLAAGEEGSGS